MTNLPVPSWAQVVPGQYDTSALFNTISNNGNFLTNPPLFAGYQSAAQSIANNTITAIGMDSTTVDTYGGHSNVTNNNRYTPNVAGWFLVFGGVGFAPNVTGGRDVEIRKNGTTGKIAQIGIQGADTSINTVGQVAALVQCNGTTDYIDMIGYQSSGVALNTVPGSTGFVVLWIHA